LTRDERRLVVDTRTFLAEHPEHRSALYLNWDEAENEGMNASAAAMKQLLCERAPKALRWAIERAPGADHQATPALAFPSALQWLFAGDASTK